MEFIEMNTDQIEAQLIAEDELSEKWKDDVEIEKTGEHAGKTVAQLKKEIAALRGKPGNKERMGELLFALRAKQGWKKKTGIAQEGTKMFTLEQLNLTEQELGDMLNLIYEFEDRPEKEMYAKFIKEDATLDQKLALLMMEVKEPTVKHGGKAVSSWAGAFLFGPFWVAYRLIKAVKEKCSRKCSLMKLNTFIRQKCMVECNLEEAKKAHAATAKINCKGKAECEQKKKDLAAKWARKVTELSAKLKGYQEKHKKLAFTV